MEFPRFLVSSFPRLHGQLLGSRGQCFADFTLFLAPMDDGHCAPRDACKLSRPPFNRLLTIKRKLAVTNSSRNNKIVLVDQFDDGEKKKTNQLCDRSQVAVPFISILFIAAFKVALARSAVLIAHIFLPSVT